LSRVSGDLLFGKLETLAVVCWHVIALFWLSSSSAFVCIFVQVLGAVIIRDVIGLGDEGMAASGEKGEDAWDRTIDLVLPVYISSGWTNSWSLLERFGEAWGLDSVESTSENLRFEPGALKELGRMRQGMGLMLRLERKSFLVGLGLWEK